MSPSVVGFKIKERRKRLNLTQAALARKLGISAAYLNLIEANKRSIGGDLLKRLAGELEMDVEMLSGATEQRLTDDLREVPSDPVLSNLVFEPGFAEKVVAHNPDWGRVMLALYRSYLDQGRVLSDMNDRVNRDPQLQTSIHRMLNHITSIRSVSEILYHTDQIKPEQRNRFHQVLNSESVKLTDDAQKLVSFFETQKASNPTAAITEQVDEFIISNQNYFSELEEVALDLQAEIKKVNRRDTEGALIDYLLQTHGVSVFHNAAVDDISGTFRNQSRFDPETGGLHFLSSSTRATRRFQIIRLAAELQYPEVLQRAVEGAALSSHAARAQAGRALASYVAAAVMMPYDDYHYDAESHGYDIEYLSQKYDVGWEQACHRLVSLKKPNKEGIPLAFMRVDPSGYVSKRFPLSRLPLPRYGHVCPLWPVFDAFQTPGRITRDLAEFPDGGRFLMISRTAIKPASRFSGHPIKYAVMMACDMIYADRMVYSRGLDPSSEGAWLPVGSSCNQCGREACQQRQELPWTMSE